MHLQPLLGTHSCASLNFMLLLHVTCHTSHVAATKSSLAPQPLPPTILPPLTPLLICPLPPPPPPPPPPVFFLGAWGWGGGGGSLELLAAHHQFKKKQCNEVRKDAQQRQTARVLPVAEGKMTGGEIPLICSTEARRSFRWHTTRCSLLIMS